MLLIAWPYILRCKPCSIVAVVDKCLEEDLAVFRATVQDIVDELEVRVPPRNINCQPLLHSVLLVRARVQDVLVQQDLLEWTPQALLASCCCSCACCLVAVQSVPWPRQAGMQACCAHIASVCCASTRR